MVKCDVDTMMGPGLVSSMCISKSANYQRTDQGDGRLRRDGRVRRVRRDGRVRGVRRGLRRGLRRGRVVHGRGGVRRLRGRVVAAVDALGVGRGRRGGRGQGRAA